MHHELGDRRHRDWKPDIEKRLKGEHTLHKPSGVAITLLKRTTISIGQMLGNHVQMFRSCQASSAWHSRRLPGRVFVNSTQPMCHADKAYRETCRRLPDICSVHMAVRMRTETAALRGWCNVPPLCF